jgi:sugar/nucleoside kinase (ribokinase family)
MQVSRGSQSAQAPRGLFVGLTTVDIVFAFDRYPDEDTKNTARQYTIAAGGPASNAAVVFSYLGGAAQLVSSLGRSSISDIARSDLVRHGVRHVDITENREREPALSAIAIAGNNGSRTIFTSPAIDDELAGPFCKEDVSAYVAGVDILLLDGHQTKLATCIAHQAKDGGVAVVLDGDLYRPNTEELLPLIDIVIFGKSFTVPGRTSNREAFKYFESFGIKHVIATHGEKLIEFVSDGVFGGMEVDEVSVVDTLAAGDFFHGAFCYSYSTGRDIQRALKFAARVASRSVTRFGTRDWMKEHEPSGFE